jgi:hypothetical protein
MDIFMFYMAVFSVIFGVAVVVSAIYENFFW